MGKVPNLTATGVLFLVMAMVPPAFSAAERERAPAPDELLERTVRLEFEEPAAVTTIIDHIADEIGLSILLNTGAFESRVNPPEIGVKFKRSARSALDYLTEKASLSDHPLAWKVVDGHVRVDHPVDLKSYAAAVRAARRELGEEFDRVIKLGFERHRDFPEILDYISDITGMKIIVNTGAFEDRERPPRVRARFEAPLVVVLEHFVREASRPGHPLAWKVVDDYVRIDNPGELKSYAEAVRAARRELGEEFDRVIKLGFDRHRDFPEILDYISDITGMKIIVNTGAFERRDRPPRVRARFEASLIAAIEHIVREASRPGYPLAWKAVDGHVRVDHPDELKCYAAAVRAARHELGEEFDRVIKLDFERHRDVTEIFDYISDTAGIQVIVNTGAFEDRERAPPVRARFEASLIAAIEHIVREASRPGYPLAWKVVDDYVRIDNPGELESYAEAVSAARRELGEEFDRVIKLEFERHRDVTEIFDYISDTAGVQILVRAGAFRHGRPPRIRARLEAPLIAAIEHLVREASRPGYPLGWKVVNDHIRIDHPVALEEYTESAGRQFDGEIGERLRTHVELHSDHACVTAVLEHFSEETGISVKFNTDVFEKSRGALPEVHADFRSNAIAAIEHIVREASRPNYPLGWKVRDGQVVIDHPVGLGLYDEYVGGRIKGLDERFRQDVSLDFEEPAGFFEVIYDLSDRTGVSIIVNEMAFVERRHQHSFAGDIMCWCGDLMDVRPTPRPPRIRASFESNLPVALEHVVRVCRAAGHSLDWKVVGCHIRMDHPDELESYAEAVRKARHELGEEFDRVIKLDFDRRRPVTEIFDHISDTAGVQIIVSTGAFRHMGRPPRARARFEASLIVALEHLVREASEADYPLEWRIMDDHVRIDHPDELESYAEAVRAARRELGEEFDRVIKLDFERHRDVTEIFDYISDTAGIQVIVNTGAFRYRERPPRVRARFEASVTVALEHLVREASEADFPLEWRIMDDHVRIDRPDDLDDYAKAVSAERREIGDKLRQELDMTRFVRHRDVTEMLDYISDITCVQIIVNTGAFEDRERPPRVRARFEARLVVVLEHFVREASRPGHPLAWKVEGDRVIIDCPDGLE